MPQLDLEQALTRRLTIAYLAGLTLIALLSGGVHVLLDRAISQQRDSATVINVAGRQRMLSQRIGLLASDLYHGDTAARAPLIEAVTLMRRSENALILGGDLGITHPLSPAVRPTYFDGPAPLDRSVRSFVETASRFAQSSPQPGGDAPADYSALQAATHAVLLPSLDHAVSVLEAEANARVDRLRAGQTAVLLTLLITLSLEAMFIFRPLVERVRLFVGTLYELATRDALTGLANRRHFIENATREIALARRAQKPLFAVLIDLDHFKRINDTHGHAVGDLVLRRFADVATANLRGTDMISRIGGEEFALVLSEMDFSGARTVAEKLCSIIAGDHSEGLPGFTISAGISMLQPNDQGIDDLLRRADGALYTAKREGRNRVALSE